MNGLLTGGVLTPGGEDNMHPPLAINLDDKISTANPSLCEDPAKTAFTTHDELLQRAQHWPLQRLVSIWNQLPGVVPVRKFENRTIAVGRIWRALQPEQTNPARSQRSRVRAPPVSS